MKRAIGVGIVLAMAGGAAAGWLMGGEEVAVTRPAVLTDQSPFRYPIDLWDRRIEGEAVLMVHVTDAGAVDSAYVLISSGQPAFDSAALAGSGELRFTPGRRGDERVATWARLPVRFRMPADSLNRGDA